MSSSRKSPFDFDVSAYPPLPRLRGLFVTGTDTEVGKTLIAGAIARQLTRRGRRIEVFKGVATGCKRAAVGGDLLSEDVEFLAVCCDSRRMLSEIAPVRYSLAVAPNVAAERQRRPVDLEAIFDSYRRLEGACDAVIVEGIGGLMCPITNDFWVVHLAKMMGLPVVIVSRSGLGTINHTLLTLHAARTAGLKVAGMVMNRYRVDPAAQAALQSTEYPYTHGDADLAMFTNPAQIAERGGAEVLAIVPDDPESSVEDKVLGADTQFAISRVDWDEIMEM